MAGAKIFVVTPKASAEEFSERILRDVIPRHRQSVIVLEEEAFGINNVTRAAKGISDVIEDGDGNRNSYLLIVSSTRADHAKLKHRWDASGKDTGRIYVGEERRVLEKFEKVSKELGYHWNAYAQIQLQRFDGQTTSLDKWCRQFFDLKVGYLARRLAMQLQVIGLSDHSRPFAPKAHEALGQKVLHCYFNDGDHGGSWINIQGELSHDLPADMVQAIHTTAETIKLPDCDADELAIYEDGLWSGRETVKRLSNIKAIGCARPIRLKFAVVTDFGLMVARHAIRYFELQNLVRIDANDAKLERFLKTDIPGEFLYGEGMEPEAYFRALHDYVEQGAFRNPADWPEGIESAIHAAKDIGSQLVQHWYKNDRPEEDAIAGAQKFCLGGGGFASTMVFTRSVPKVSLPLFWLAGPVTLNGVSVNWKPLFLDARRINPKLLMS